MGKAGWSPPKEFDGYRMERVLGRGGMGMVYIASDTVLERPVAIKFIAAADASVEARKRFLVEARAIARLQHPNVVTIYRVGEVDGRPYLVSELVRGKGLDRLATPVRGDQLLSIASGIATGLAAAHARGVVHRDIKPANVLLTMEGEIKILDFGIAKLLDPGSEIAKRQSLDPPSLHRISARRPPPIGDPDAETAELETEPSSGSLAGLHLDGHITRPGIVVGTPYYLAPELWRGEPATFASDVYALGVLLFALATGYTPHESINPREPEDEPTPIAVLRESVQRRDAPPLESVANIDPKLCRIIDMCLKRDPRERFPSASELRMALQELTEKRADRPLVQGNPYRGLHAFDADHRGVFFGRETEIVTIIERLRTNPFVLVAGDSGVGKSSLCRAGVVPRAASSFEGGRVWQVCSVVPGRAPVAAIAAGLAPLLDLAEETVVASIHEDPAAFGREIRKTLGASRGILLFIDQLEELVTVSDQAEANAVGTLLERFVTENPSLRLLATVRGDFLSRLAGLPSIAETISRALYFLRPLTPDRIREAIVSPARAKGGRFESERLVSVLVESTAQADGSLPLLQFALAELWEAREIPGDVITEAALERLGGVEGALSRHADALISSLGPKERQAARGVLLGLVTPSGTRASKSGSELVLGRREAQSALEALVQGRVVVVRETPDGATYEIAHEALITGWPLMAQFRTEDAGARLLRERVATAVGEWERAGHAPDTLLGARALEEVRSLPKGEFTPLEQAFILASRRAHLRSRVLKVIGVVGFPAALGLTYLLFVLKARADVHARADAELDAAQHLITLAEAAGEVAREAERGALQKFDSQKADKSLEVAESEWRSALAKRAEEQLLYSQASARLETALTWDRERAPVRRAFASVLLERAKLAEMSHATTVRDELVSRLALYDDDGSFQRVWNAPATVTFTLSPGADEERSLSLLRFDTDPAGQRVGNPLLTLTVRGARSISIAQGSYIALVRATGTELRMPFVAKRGESTVVNVAFPETDAPKGFVYVPSGDFLFGSHDEDSVRRGFFHTVPEHSVTTDAYFIAERETTFGDWIDYLKVLPPTERAARLPSTKGGFEGALKLEELPPDSWQLTIQPGDKRFVAKLGAPVVYEKRSVRRDQNWLKMPVSGITAEDAEAYALFLRREGRVPLARLCTEHEWERAARGADDRLYPHGDSLQPDDANFDQTYGKKPESIGPDEVGSHPGSVSPFGVFDMAGNVWEWTVSNIEPGEHAARGGSFYFDVNTSRAYSREVTEASFRDVSVGVRICASAPRAGSAR